MDYTKLYINVANSIEELIPVDERKPINTEYMKLFANEMQVSHDEMYETVVDVWRIIAYGTQVGVFEEYLNDNYDNDNRGITITNNNVSQGLITLYLTGEYDPTPDTLYPAKSGKGWELYLSSEIATLTFFNYTIDVPISVWSALSTREQEQFIARANIFNPAGKQYNITQS